VSANTPTVPQGQPNANPTPPPRRRPGFGLIAFSVVVVVLLLLFGTGTVTLGLGNSSQKVPTATRPSDSSTKTGSIPTVPAASTTSPASTPSASPAAGAAIPAGTPLANSAACKTAPKVPQRSFAVTLPQPAGSAEARSALSPLGASGYDTVFYTGEPKSATVLNQWMSDVQCAGMASALQVDNVFNGKGVVAGKTFVAAVQGHADLKAFVVSMNGVPDGTSDTDNANAVNNRAMAIKSQTGKPVWCQLDFMTSRQANTYSGCDRKIIGYFPWRSSAKYGPVSRLKDVGTLTKQLDGANATVGVQAFDWWASEPDTAKALGFTKNSAGLPAPTDVRDMAKLATSRGSVNVVVVSEEPAADNIPYLVRIARTYLGTKGRVVCTVVP